LNAVREHQDANLVNPVNPVNPVNERRGANLVNTVGELS
jgi:hypothetical protein